MGSTVQYFTYRADVPASAFLKRILEGENYIPDRIRRLKSARVSVARAAIERTPEVCHDHSSPDWQSVRRSVWVGPPSLGIEIWEEPRAMPSLLVAHKTPLLLAPCLQAFFTHIFLIKR